MKPKKYNQNSVIRGALRRAFARSPMVDELMKASRREVPRYNKDGSRHKKNWVQRECQVCQEWKSGSKMAVDHIIPVVSVDDGFQDWNIYIQRLWCDKSNLQRICDTCHDKKTNAERIARLLKQYTLELDGLEKTVNAASGMRNMIGGSTNGFKDLRKAVNKYTAKKKTLGLEPVVERALKLKERINVLIKNYAKE